jgi:L-arabinose isomerase
MNQNVTSFDAANPGTFGDILTQRGARGAGAPVGLLGVGYFEYWRMYPSLKAVVEADLQRVSERLAATATVVYPGMVDTLDRAEEAGRAFREARVEAVVVVEGTYLPDFIVLQALEQVPNARVILFGSQTGPDISPTDTYEATMRNSALIGITQLSATLQKAGRAYDVVIGEVAAAESYREIARRLQAQRIARDLRGLTIGMVGHVFRGMFDLEFDRGAVRGRLGPEVMTIQAEHLVDLWKEVSPAETTAKARELAERYPLRGIAGADLERSVRLGLAMRRLVQRYHLDALCFLGQHYIEKMTGAPARLGASMLLDEDRFMVACEGDVGGLIMMQILHALTGRLPVQMEWGQFDLAHNALFLLGHGIASPTIAGGPTRVTLTRAPEEWGFVGGGVNWEMIVEPGPVTMGHFLSTPTGWRMVISEGEALAFPCLPCEEIHALVRVQTPVREYLTRLVTQGAAHHVIVVHGSVTADLEQVADSMGVQKLLLR